MPDRERYGWTGGGVGREGAVGNTGRWAGNISNLRSIPPRTSTGRGFRELRSVRYAQDGHGAASASRNHSRPARPAPELSAPLIPESVEPVVDIFDEGDCILVVAEVPGAEENSIRVELEDHTLKLWARGKFREYRGEVALPGEMRPASLAWTLNNGVINLRLARLKRKGNGRRRPSGR